MKRHVVFVVTIALGSVLGPGVAQADDRDARAACRGLPSHADLRSALNMAQQHRMAGSAWRCGRRS